MADWAPHSAIFYHKKTQKSSKNKKNTLFSKKIAKVFGTFKNSP